MMARRLPGILPPLTFDEALAVTSVHSVAGLLPAAAGLVSERPFRAPHHTASAHAIVGGGPQIHPGEISLAHRGVLFLDELPEFDRRVLESLREPLETGSITIARARSRLLPRPGAWMETFKQLMAFPLYATVGYLLWVLAGQVQENGLLSAFSGLVLIAMGAWFYGRWRAPGAR